MNLIKTINAATAGKTKASLREDAAGGAVGAGAVGGFAMPLFSSLVKRNAPKAKVKPDGKPAKKKGLGLKEAYRTLSEELDINGGGMGGTKAPGVDFDSSGVIAKLKSLENREKSDNRDTVTFGLEDDDGGLVRVIVKSEEAEDFERALQMFLVDREQEDQDIPEIAEVLFKLKDQFSIVDVQWPEVEQDEEQETNLEGGEGDMGEMGAEGGEMDLDAGGMGGADTGQVQDLLTQVIDMMKADAEARKAEARAKEAEAKAKEADAIIAQTMARVKQEEQYLDMETQEKARKEEEKEAKRLAKLAKWKHEMSQEHGIEDEPSFDEPAAPAPEPRVAPRAAPEEEESTMMGPPRSKLRPVKKGATIQGRVHPHKIASYILNRVK